MYLRESEYLLFLESKQVLLKYTAGPPDDF